MKRFFYILFALLVCLSGCRQTDKQFTRLEPGDTGINFRNLLLEDNPDFNIVLYPYFYNGGGIAAGDLNNDGLDDLVFTGNMAKNRLYINKGNLEFEDITEQSGIAAKEGWCTGVTIADVNADGKQDIYICRSGLKNVDYRRNLLFINNGNNQFTEKAASWGIDDPGYSTQASFFDYDRDGDLDLFLINQSSPEYSIGKLEHATLRKTLLDSTLENKLFRNDGNHFTNVTHAAGISSNALTFSLGLSTADIDQDGWPDIYVANDFNENDYYYINNQNGSFTRREADMFSHFSQYSMGCDVNDYNNDALPDLITLDMLSEDNYAQKMHMGGDNYDKFQALFNYGFQHQYMKNTLQRNNGDGTFSEIGQLAGISATDWSWSPLLADFDNDGLKDLFITNGYKRDNTNMQFVKFSMDHALKMQQGASAMPVADYIAQMPGILLPNYIYRNSGTDVFENKSKSWGFDESFDSHGAVYADLDNDGDLDLITNNTDNYASVYRNNNEKKENQAFLSVKLEGPAGNGTGIGAKIWVHTGARIQYQEMLPVRGYQSSVPHRLHFGLGNTTGTIDSVRVQWPDGKCQVIKQVKINQLLQIKHQSATSPAFGKTPVKPIFGPADSLPFSHNENIFNDFKQQYLLNDFLSRPGPCMAKADINSDGLEDLFIGGAIGQQGAILLQQPGGQWKPAAQPAFAQHTGAEDTDAIFADVNGDGKTDLIVTSGGYEQIQDTLMLQNRLYLNTGNGIFRWQAAAFTTHRTNTSSVAAADVDGDGDTDVFFGSAEKPGQYPIAQPSALYINNGKGVFTEASVSWLADLKEPLLLRDAQFADLNNDKRPDLVLAGDYISPKIMLNNGRKLADESARLIPSGMAGMYNNITIADLDNDQKPDLILGNTGLNTQFKSTPQWPSSLHYKDYDGNGIIDPVFHYFIGNTSFPAMPKDDITAQIPLLNKRYLNYPDYAAATTATLFTPEEAGNERILTLEQQETIVLMQTAVGFEPKKLPLAAQYSKVYAIVTTDVNKDGKSDILLLGNNRFTRIKYGEYNAGHGILLIGKGDGTFDYLPQHKSGLAIRADIRSAIQLQNGRMVLGVNNGRPMIITQVN